MQTTSKFALVTTLFTSSIFGAKDMTFERKSEGRNYENVAGLAVIVLETVVCLPIEKV